MRIVWQTSLACGLLLLGTEIGVTSTALAAPPDVQPVPSQAEPFALARVRLLDGPFQDAQRRNAEYLLSLEPDRLLHSFRLNAGLPTRAQPLGGWEKPDWPVRGFTLGQYLSACSFMYSATGDDRFKHRADALVDGLTECQEALPSQGFQPGYLAAFPESFIDMFERNESVWAPWYVLNKILAGLIDAHQHCGNRRALETAVRMADWTKTRMDRLPAEQRVQAIESKQPGTGQVGAIGESLADLAAITGKDDYVRCAQLFIRRSLFDPLSEGKDCLDGRFGNQSRDGRHGNETILETNSLARLYELTGDPYYRNAAETYWRLVAHERAYVIGGYTDREFFFPVTDFAKHLSRRTCETCNTYNMLRLTQRLFAWTPASQWMEWYERALYNHILAAQDPEQGGFVYYMSMKPGDFKAYSTPLDSFWCCVGTGMEVHARHGEAIYYHGAESLYVSLFISSELTWLERGVTVRQETQFPDEDTVRLTFQCADAIDLKVHLRHPSWADGMTVAVNGQPVDAGKPGAYAIIDRVWREGDRVEIRLPRQLRTESLPGNPNVVAFLYGPIVLAGELGSEGIRQEHLYLEDFRTHDKGPLVVPPVLVCNDPSELVRRFEPAGTPLCFRSHGIGKPEDVSLVPFYRLHRQYQAVYWNVLSSEAWHREHQ